MEVVNADPVASNCPLPTGLQVYSIYCTYPGGMEGWVYLGDLLHTEMVYPPSNGHPSKY